jgi:ABC-2 type transport system ATP-binding protein
LSRSHGQHAIDLTHVEKIYRGRVHALRGISMKVRAGEVFGLLGPNGAGKSTLVKIMMTVVRPTRANGTLLGRPIGNKAVLAHVGYLPEHQRLPSYLTGARALDFFGALAKVDRATRRQRIPRLLDMVGMTEWAHKKVSSYSKGMQQRVGLAQALMNDPQLLLLDEPTDGVDPVGRREFREVVRQLRDQGKTIFINSHLLSELEMVCQRVAILVQGKIIKQGKIDELTAASSRYEIIIRAHDVPWARDDERMRWDRLETGRWRLTLPNATVEQVQPVIDRLRQQALLIESVELARDSLEDLFLQTVTTAAPRAPLVVGAPRE